MALCAGLGLASEARAQFANRSLGFQVGYLSLNGVAGGELDFAVPIGLTGSLYIENGFDLVAHVGIMVTHDTVTGSNVVALDGPAVGVRYLFMEESIRPFVGLDLSYLQLFGTANQQNTAYAGLGPNLGLELFLSDSISVSLKGRFNLYVSLNEVWTSFGANLGVSTYF